MISPAQQPNVPAPFLHVAWADDGAESAPLRARRALPQQGLLDFGLAVDEMSLQTFIPGSNALLLARVQDLLQHPRFSPLYCWGEAGCGKTHLLRGAAWAITQQGERALWLSAHAREDWPEPGEIGEDGSLRLILLEDCDALESERQQCAFAHLLWAQSLDIAVISAARSPFAALTLREDLKSRLGWGGIFAVQALSESDARVALRMAAQRRGFTLSGEVEDFLWSHFARDLGALSRLLARLDTFSLEQKRRVTVALLRTLVQREGEAPGNPAAPLPLLEPAR